jgi:hypothetical protein
MCRECERRIARPSCLCGNGSRVKGSSPDNAGAIQSPAQSQTTVQSNHMTVGGVLTIDGTTFSVPSTIVPVSGIMMAMVIICPLTMSQTIPHLMCQFFTLVHWMS